MAACCFLHLYCSHFWSLHGEQNHGSLLFFTFILFSLLVSPRGVKPWQLVVFYIYIVLTSGLSTGSKTMAACCFLHLYCSHFCSLHGEQNHGSLLFFTFILFSLLVSPRGVKPWQLVVFYINIVLTSGLSTGSRTMAACCFLHLYCSHFWSLHGEQNHGSLLFFTFILFSLLVSPRGVKP